jgi:FKBP-type peptidyl-prolyl cis-trans isomerase SlyD
MTVIIENDALVELAYTLTDDCGTTIDGTEEGRTISYVHGHEQIIPALEAALAGLRAGDETELTLPPERAYGEIDPAARAEVPKHALPPEALKPGTEVTARGPHGETRYVTVNEIREDTVVLDMNHPFAGKTVHFHLRVVQVVPRP